MLSTANSNTFYHTQFDDPSYYNIFTHNCCHCHCHCCCRCNFYKSCTNCGCNSFTIKPYCTCGCHSPIKYRVTCDDTSVKTTFTM